MKTLEEKREAQRISSRKFRAAHPERAKRTQHKAHLNRFYKMSYDEYEARVLDQQGVCAICQKPDPASRLSVDHDHACCPGERSCGKCTRALLCIQCNVALGNFRDDINLLEAALAYLRKFA